MSTQHAVLGLLRRKPGYPYQLAGLLETQYGPAWGMSEGQVYQAVKKLEKDGLIERVNEEAGGRGVRAITPAGLQEFEAWFESGSLKGGQLIRRPVVLKVRMSGPERLEAALSQLDRFETACTARLEEIRALREAEDPEGGPYRLGEAELLRLSLTADILQLEAELRWAKRARESVRSLITDDAIWLSTQDRASDPSDLARREARERLLERVSARDAGGAAQ